MNRKLLAGLLAASLWGATALSASAADPVLTELYGEGVHAFNVNKYTEAHELLTEAIDGGARDPRAYFYRGLVYARTGRPEQAEADFKEAAALEVSNDSEVFNVGRALERVQGPERREIERHRRAARVAVVKQQARAERARYEESVEREDRVIRRPAGSGATAETPPAERLPAAEGATPFDNGIGAAPAERAPDMPMTTEEPAGATDDPFGKPAPMKTPAAADADPFGAPMKKPAATDDPFGNDAGAAPVKPAPADPAPPAADPPPGDDPFGNDAGAAPVKPAPADPAPATDDPFGNDAGAAPVKPAPADPAPATDDPFGNDAGAAKPMPPMKENPFGDDPVPAGDAPANPMAGTAKKGFFGKMFGAGTRALPGQTNNGGAGNAAEANPLAPPPMAKPPEAAPPMDDPFGGAAEKPAVEPKNEPAAPAGDDPFAPMDAVPAEPKKEPAAPAGDDPFAPSEPKAEPKAPPKASDDPFAP